MTKNKTIELAAPLPDSEVAPIFLQGMVDRMAMSFFKYGRVADGFPAKIDALKSLRVRLEKYEATGNSEFLMDAANFAMIEFMHPRHPGAHFRPTDSDESPGRVSAATGTSSQAANTLEMENIRRGGSRLTTSGGFYQKEGD